MQGTLGVPVIDAHMRQLGNLGVMVTTGRTLCARYLVEELYIDWRRGAAHYQEFLLGDDPFVTWGEFARAAGVGGLDCAPIMVLDLDGYQVSEADLRFIRAWCPEHSHQDLRKDTYSLRAPPKPLLNGAVQLRKGKGKGKGAKAPTGKEDKAKAAATQPVAKGGQGTPAGMPSSQMLDALGSAKAVKKEASKPPSPVARRETAKPTKKSPKS